MKLPNLPREGESAQQTMRDVIACLRAFRVLSVDGVPASTSPNGTVLTSKAQPPKTPPSVNFPFKVSLSKEDEQWKASVVPGYVRGVTVWENDGTGDTVEDMMPDGMDDDPRPTFDVEAGQGVFCRVEVANITGNLEGATIVVENIDIASDLLVYYFLLAEIIEDPESEADPPPLIVKQHQYGSPIPVIGRESYAPSAIINMNVATLTVAGSSITVGDGGINNTFYFHHGQWRGDVEPDDDDWPGGAVTYDFYLPILTP